jgi:hypothetical protein
MQTGWSFSTTANDWQGVYLVGMAGLEDAKLAVLEDLGDTGQIAGYHVIPKSVLDFLNITDGKIVQVHAVSGSLGKIRAPGV